jgi:hypothetical protein
MPRIYESPEDMAASGHQAERVARRVAIVTPLATLAAGLVEAATGNTKRIVPTLVAGATLTGAAVMTMFEGQDTQQQAERIAQVADYQGADIVTI